MASAAMNVSVEVFNLLGQVDAIFAAARAATQACGGSVRPARSWWRPWGEPGWREVVFYPWKPHPWPWLVPLFKHPNASDVGWAILGQFEPLWSSLLKKWECITGKEPIAC